MHLSRWTACTRRHKSRASGDSHEIFLRALIILTPCGALCVKMLTSTPARPWAAWLQENAGRLLLFARQQTRSDADAQDVLQEALLRLWQRGDAAIPDAALVYTTIRRAAIDAGRSMDRRSQREGRWAGEQTMHADAWFDPDPASRELAAEVREKLESLSPVLREAIVLRVWGDLSFAEIARILEIPLQTAASRCRLAVEQLRRHFIPALS